MIKYFTLSSLLTKGLAGIEPVDIPGIQNVRCFIFLSMYKYFCKVAIIWITQHSHHSWNLNIHII